MRPSDGFYVRMTGSAQRYEIGKNIRGLVVHYAELLKWLNVMHVQIAANTLLTYSAALTAIAIALACLLALSIPVRTTVPSGHVEWDSSRNALYDLLWSKRRAKQLIAFSSTKPRLVHAFLHPDQPPALPAMVIDWRGVALDYIRVFTGTWFRAILALKRLVTAKYLPALLAHKINHRIDMLYVALARTEPGVRSRWRDAGKELKSTL